MDNLNNIQTIPDSFNASSVNNCTNFDTESITQKLITRFEGCASLVPHKLSKEPQILWKFSDESIILYPYLCPAGVWTIGFGETEYLKQFSETDKSSGACSITLTKALEFLNGDITKIHASLRRIISKPLQDNQYAALASLAYNIGVHAFEGSSLLITINENPYNHGKLHSLWLEWCRVGTAINDGLKQRRETEFEVYCKT